MRSLLLHVFLIASLIVIVYNSIVISSEKRLDKRINEKLDLMNEEYKKRITKYRFRQYYSIKSKRKRLIQDLDLLVQQSNCRRYIPFITAEVVIFVQIIIFLIAYLAVYSFLFNPLGAVLVGGVFSLIPRFILATMASKNAEKVDYNLVNFVDQLQSFCNTFDNIVYAIENSIQFINEPLRTYSIAFVSEVKHGVSIIDALENFKGKVTNKRFKMLMKNLELCAKFKGSYLLILKKSSARLSEYALERDRRKSEVRKYKGDIFLLIVVVAMIVDGIFNMFPMLYNQIRTDKYGQIIVVINILIIIYALFSAMTISKSEL